MNEVGDSIVAENANWSFDGEVSKNFDQHVSKSVPLYQEGHKLIVKLSDFFLNNNSRCYDLGCSTGTLIYELAKRNKSKEIKFYGLEIIDGMIEESIKRCKEFSNISILKSNIEDSELENSDLIISYYTMQFIKPKFRQEIFNKIYKALNWGGAFISFSIIGLPTSSPNP